MKLEAGIYTIPSDCTAIYVGRKVVVKKMKARPIVKHCSDCIHQQLGKKCLLNQAHDSYYCDIKPKTIGGKDGYFYNASSFKVACYMFEPKTEE